MLRQQRGTFKGILRLELKLGCSRGPALHPGGQRHPAEEPAGSPKKGVTCFNFGIRQEEDGFVSSATPFQLFPERQWLEDVAGPNYNIGEPAPAALPSFAPAVGTISSFWALCLMDGFPLRGGPVPRAPVLWMALHKARLRMGVSAPAGPFPGWVRAGARAARAGSWGVGVMGSRNAGQCRGHRWGPGVRLHSRSEPAPSQFAEGDQKLIAGFCCTWQERGRAPAPSLPPASPGWSSVRWLPAETPRRLPQGEPLPSPLVPWPDPARLPLAVPSSPSK